MYNIIVFGTGSTASTLNSILNGNTNVLCYIDNDKRKWGQEFSSKLILEPKEINNLDYDFIVIASQYNEEIYSQLINMGISKNAIFEYINFFNIANNKFEYSLNVYKENVSVYETLITGISYFVNGIHSDTLLKRGINFSFDSQDLYYDYNIAKHLLENYNTNFKYCVIGLSYYCFQYDLSLSAMKNNVNLYYRTLMKSHYYKVDESFENRLDVNKEIAGKILNLINTGTMYGFEYKEKKLTEEKNLLELGQKQAQIDCNKDYPETVKENKELLVCYLKMLKNYNVKPIIVVCPTSKYYYNCFSKRIENEFFDIIKIVGKEYNFQYIDYFKSNLFDDSDFKDVSHLTIDGGRKFTNIINDLIDW
ncbi:MAG: chemotaxis protein [Clostridium beijerinckii]|jgi:hypothetical protein|uniref:D-alanyl-lipoteichoic acid biosynthesis protein DltD n=1 Tax=Clostridium beijerinckii TaxID=1520 RepID=UPI0014943220|nr:D-alanyl-lipoteichoic acid biosynthesis protein DltD [Clostridium beijerinckii]MCI1477716.1 chemotaxis protein [Clostridium beijerinckii]MCI1577968.1 chemotaxis protein [Clostridium beijerinckii]MCI1583690.1 chemotaxis protein [Clostridium beijerinckii]MCI1620621.1 chemotaxis protein [Clostridium beijerinckii]NOW87858.1 hypothetical protein [Clostridium beijerinckii]